MHSQQCYESKIELILQNIQDFSNCVLPSDLLTPDLPPLLQSLCNSHRTRFYCNWCYFYPLGNIFQNSLQKTDFFGQFCIFFIRAVCGGVGSKGGVCYAVSSARVFSDLESLIHAPFNVQSYHSYLSMGFTKPLLSSLWSWKGKNKAGPRILLIPPWNCCSPYSIFKKNCYPFCFFPHLPISLPHLTHFLIFFFVD